MNKTTIIGNLTRDPESRTTDSSSVCSFMVAVNRLGKSGGADYFRVSAWGGLGESCQQYLAKGRKVCVVGRISASAYTGQDGSPRASLDLLAEDVEFLSPKEPQ
jgi:single-strand DNA-binding protein